MTRRDRGWKKHYVNRCQDLGHRLIRSRHRGWLLCTYCDEKLSVREAKARNIPIIDPEGEP